MSSVMYLLGCLMAGAGVIFGLLIYSDIDQQALKTAEQVFKSLPTNIYARQEYLMESQAVAAKTYIAIAGALSGIISGCIFLSLGLVLDKLEAISKAVMPNVASEEVPEEKQPKNIEINNLADAMQIAHRLKS